MDMFFSAEFSRLWVRSRTRPVVTTHQSSSPRHGRLPGSHGLGHAAVPSCPQLFSSRQRTMHHHHVSRPSGQCIGGALFSSPGHQTSFTAFLLPCAAVDRAPRAAVCERVSRGGMGIPNPRQGTTRRRRKVTTIDVLAVSASTEYSSSFGRCCHLIIGC